jgi:hypothetical protein
MCNEHILNPISKLTCQGLELFIIGSLIILDKNSKELQHLATVDGLEHTLCTTLHQQPVEKLCSIIVLHELLEHFFVVDHYSFQCLDSEADGVEDFVRRLEERGDDLDSDWN